MNFSHPRLSALHHAAARWQALGVERQHEVIAGLKQGLLMGLAAAAVLLPPAGSAHLLARPSAQANARVASSLLPPHGSAVGQMAGSPTTRTQPILRADFRDVQPSDPARTIADWVADSRDNKRLPFVVLDKRGARVYVFDAGARLLGSSMVLLGSAIGDDTPAGVGNKSLAEIRPEERTTPAGRFVSEPGRDDTGDDVVWVDYDAAVAMHRVKVIDPKERRFERIATPSAEDKRISNGCINVPIPFFDAVVKPTLGAGRAVVYVLPDVKPLKQVFADAYDVSTRHAVSATL
jgi:hypothetical protein